MFCLVYWYRNPSADRQSGGHEGRSLSDEPSVEVNDPDRADSAACPVALSRGRQSGHPAEALDGQKRLSGGRGHSRHRIRRGKGLGRHLRARRDARQSGLDLLVLCGRRRGAGRGREYPEAEEQQPSRIQFPARRCLYRLPSAQRRLYGFTVRGHPDPARGGQAAGFGFDRSLRRRLSDRYGIRAGRGMGRSLAVRRGLPGSGAPCLLCRPARPQRNRDRTETRERNIARGNLYG